MRTPSGVGLSRWLEAELAAALFAVDPIGLGGIVVRAQAGPVRDAWAGILRSLLPDMPLRRLPLNVGDDRLLGGVDLAASLAAGRPIADTGFLAEADGGIVLLPMAERLPAALAARLGSVLDSGGVLLERDGLALRTPSRFGIVAFDEGLAEEERPPPALRDRLAFGIDLDAIPLRDTEERGASPEQIAEARDRLHDIVVGDALLDALSAASLALGIGSFRAPLFALRACRAAAALFGRSVATGEDAALAARLVFSHRATILPQAETPDAEPESTAEDPEKAEDSSQPDRATGMLEDVVLAAAQAAIPPGLLATLSAGRVRTRTDAFGRSGARVHTLKRGRPAGVRRGKPGGGAKLNLIETLRAAAPWQPLRRSEREVAGAVTGRRIEVRRDDFRITRFRQQTETTTIFVVDASGSSAFHRLAEVKGAVELLLADCYVRRDRVALIAFRGSSAELVLPPTRALARAKRNLAGLPGGGQTPLASGIDAALALSDAVQRSGRMPAIVLMTDARANTTRAGTTDRVVAAAESLSAARLMRARGTMAILVDTSPRSRPEAAALAEAMGARYVPLPHAGSATLSAAVKGSVEEARQGSAR